MIILLATATLIVLGAASDSDDPASYQLPRFDEKTDGPIGILSTDNGAPVDARDSRSSLNSVLLNNDHLTEIFARQMRERIPERIVHAKGAGAFGYFQVTHNITHICKADLFSEVGKKTPVVVRFSPSSNDKGESDTVLDSRGFVVKFYTKEGNFDIVGFHTPLFIYKEPLLFVPVARVIKRNPVTNLRDRHMFWDLICLRPEVLPFFLFLFGDNGIPKGYRYMPGFSIHTYQVYNKRGKSYFVRFHILPDLGIKNLYAKEAAEIGSADPDYAVRDLYNAIENGDFPSWTVSIQVLTAEDVKKAKFDVFDITKILFEDEYPLHPVGKLVLNRNPKNFFADVEQTAFCPGNLVPGILGAPDKSFETRRFFYKDAQRYRLGVNFQNINVNYPFNSKYQYNYNRDGRAPVRDNGKDTPNYFPNSYDGSVPYVEKNRPKLITIKQYDDSYNFEQIAKIYDGLSNDERNRMVNNIVFTLKLVDEDLKRRVVDLFKAVHPDLSYRTRLALSGSKKDYDD